MAIRRDTTWNTSRGIADVVCERKLIEWETCTERLQSTDTTWVVKVGNIVVCIEDKTTWRQVENGEEDAGNST